MTGQPARAVSRTAADGQAMTLRELDALVADATAAGVPWDSVVYIRGTRFVSPSKADGVPFRAATVGPDWRS